MKKINLKKTIIVIVVITLVIVGVKVGKNMIIVNEKTSTIEDY